MSTTAAGQSSSKPDFLVVMRGYDRTQVDTYFAQVKAQFDRALAHIDALEKENTALREAATRVEATTPVAVSPPTPEPEAKPEPEPAPHPVAEPATATTSQFSEVGVKVAAILQAAEDEARKVRELAQNQAAQIAEEARHQADLTRADGEAKASQIEQDAHELADQIRRQADEDAAEAKAAAETELDALRADHDERVAQQLRDLDVQAAQVMADAQERAQQAEEAADQAEQQRERTLAEAREQYDEMIESAQRRSTDLADQILRHAESEHERILRETNERVKSVNANAELVEQRRREVAEEVRGLAAKLQEVATHPVLGSDYDELVASDLSELLSQPRPEISLSLPEAQSQFDSDMGRANSPSFGSGGGSAGFGVDLLDEPDTFAPITPDSPRSADVEQTGPVDVTQLPDHNPWAAPVASTESARLELAQPVFAEPGVEQAQVGSSFGDVTNAQPADHNHSPLFTTSEDLSGMASKKTKRSARNDSTDQ